MKNLLCLLAPNEEMVREHARKECFLRTASPKCSVIDPTTAEPLTWAGRCEHTRSASVELPSALVACFGREYESYGQPSTPTPPADDTATARQRRTPECLGKQDRRRRRRMGLLTYCHIT